MENKSTYFYADITIRNPENYSNEFYIEGLDDDMDLVLDKMGVSEESYKFRSNDGKRTVVYFKPDKRKRKGQFSRLCVRYLAEEIVKDLQIGGLTRNEYLSGIKNFTESNSKFKVLEKPNEVLNEDYDRNDIKHFDQKENWMEWHKEIYNSLFDESNKLKTPDDRKITYILDLVGKSGKSQFYKWLFNKYPKMVGRISYGTASQLKSSMVNMGAKKIYIIDLARSVGKNDSQSDLLSAIEDLKSGLVINPMFGNGKVLEMAPPHIIISANYLLDLNSLSADRWDAYELCDTNKKIRGNLNKKLNKLTKKRIIQIEKKREEEVLKKQLEEWKKKHKLKQLITQKMGEEVAEEVVKGRMPSSS